MATVCLYFQVHQPFRVRKGSYFDAGRGLPLFDEPLDRLVMERAAERCYLPANGILAREALRLEGRLKLAFSITGTAIEQMKLYAPAALESFQALVSGGCVELLGETYYHSLASLYSEEEFRQQVAQHTALMLQEFGVRPAVMRNTELLYSDEIGELAHSCGFRAVLAEGSDATLGWRSPNAAYRCARSPLPLLLKNYRLSDDIAFRFSSADGDGKALTAASFAQRLQALPADTEAVGIFVDYETFGEHLGEGTAIASFLEELPSVVCSMPSWGFSTPSGLAERAVRREALSVPSVTSWADLSRDASAWTGNGMQQAALSRIYEMAGAVLATGDPELIAAWRKLQSSDHFYYMSTKEGGDGVVHRHFSPFESPYEAFIAYMNVVRDLAARAGIDA